MPRREVWPKWSARVPFDAAAVFWMERNKLSPEHQKLYVQQRDRYEEIFQGVLKEGIRKGEFECVDVKLTSYAVLGMVNWLAQWYKPEGQHTPEYIANQFTRLVVDLMLAKRARDCRQEQAPS